MDKEDGISAARRIRTYDKNVRIIYVTSHESYMRESFEGKTVSVSCKTCNR